MRVTQGKPDAGKILPRNRCIRRDHNIIALRLIGTVLAALPAIRTVRVSAYSQRLDSATAQQRDDYLLSVNATRAAFGGINFEQLDQLDPVAALERFELRRDMSKNGTLKPIEPFAPRV